MFDRILKNKFTSIIGVVYLGFALFVLSSIADAAECRFATVDWFELATMTLIPGIIGLFSKDPVWVAKFTALWTGKQSDGGS